MTNLVHYSPASLKDLDEIWTSIEEDLQNPDAAQKSVLEIVDSIGRLEVFPEMGTPLSSIIEVKSDYRFLVCGNYLVFYHCRKTEIFIDRVLYGKRDYLSILFNVN